MNEKQTIWNNTINKHLTEIWNSTDKNRSPDCWNNKMVCQEIWTNALALPANWGTNEPVKGWNTSQNNNSRTLPNLWKNELTLPDNWGNSSDAPKYGSFSAKNGIPAKITSEAINGGIDFSAMARLGAGKLAGAAKKVGTTAKNAAGSAVEYARSDDVKDKLNSAKNKARSAADSAGSALTGLMNNAGRFIDERRSSSSSADNSENDENVVITDYSADNTDGYNSGETDMSDTEYQPKNNRYPTAYESPDHSAVYTYAAEKKSPVVFILLGVIGVLILGVGLLGGMLLMKNKDAKNNPIAPSAVNETTQQQTSAENINDTDTAEWLGGYRGILQSFMLSAEYNSNSAYELYDVDDNGIPELFVSEGEFHTAATTVYTFNNGQCIKLLDQNNTDGILYLLPRNHYLVYYTSYYGRTSLDVYSLNNYELKVIEKFYDDSYQYSSPENDVVYMHNGESVTMESYKSSMDKYNRSDFIAVGRSNSFADIDSYFNTLANNANTTFTETAATTAAVAVQKIVKEYKAGDINKYPQYIKVIKDNLDTVSSELKFKGVYDIADVGYALYDINADNTPELVISAGYIDIYSIYGGDVVELTPFWGGNVVKGIYIYENGNISMSTLSVNGDGGTTFYRYDGGKELTTIDYTTFDLQTSESAFYHDGQLVSEEEFDKITSLFGQQISVSSMPVTNISEITSYIDQKSSEKYTSYDPSAAGNDFSFSQGKTECAVNTESDDLNLRDKPSTNGAVILTIPKGAAVYEYAHNSEWSYISYNKGGTTYYGYASRKYIKEKGSTKYTSYDTSAAGNDFSFNQSASECKVNVDSGDLNLRAAPSMNGEVIILMPKDAIIYEYGHNHVWSYVSYSTGGTTYYGYANKQFIISVNEKVQVVSCNKKGTINASQGEVAGFAGSYVVDGGTSKLIRKSLDHGWHVTAVNYCYSRGILWYELYDTDDNDYYGWVDASFISFY